MQNQGFIPVGCPDITELEEQKMLEVLRSGWLTTGPMVNKFEEEISRYLNADGSIHSIALNSCTAGLFLALKALDVGPGDEVIVPCVTYVATSHVVEWCGARVVMCDVDERTRNIDLEDLERKVTPNTKVIMPVHIGGYPCEMEKIWQIADRHSLFVVEDAAHALGAAGPWGKVGTGKSSAIVFSFYANKNLSCGEGGMVVTSDPELAEKIRMLSYFGINKRAHQRYTEKGTWYYEVENLGYKYNMDSIHAALGTVQLQRFESMQSRRREMAILYSERLAGIKELELPLFSDGHAWHLYQILVKEDQRDRFSDYLRGRGIGTSVHFIPLYRHPHYADRYIGENFPSSEKIFPRSLSLPMHSRLTPQIVHGICDEVIQYFSEGNK